MSHSMVKASANDTSGRLDGLLVSRQFLAFDLKMPMEPWVDRLELPMELRQLKINREGYEAEKEQIYWQ